MKNTDESIKFEEFRKLCGGSRSVRSFKRESIGKNTLEELCDLCRYTPSTANLQALKFRPVCEAGETASVFAATKWAGYIKDEKLPPEGHEPAAYIIICCDREIAPNVVPFYKDTGICAQTVMLGARALGLGGCMIGSFDAEKIKAALKLPQQYEITLVLALGVPDEAPEIVDAECGDIKYYRRNGQHFVPKRVLEEIIIR